MAPAYLPPYLRRVQQADDWRPNLPYPRGQPLQPHPAAHNPPSASTGDSIETASAPMASYRHPAAPSYPGHNILRRGVIASSTAAITTPRVQNTDEAYRYRTYGKNCQLLQPKPITTEQCEENEEYAKWAGGFFEVDDKLFSMVCPCNLVGKPCAFDGLPEGCLIIRLCGQLEKWTLHKCPDNWFRTILDSANDVPADYGEKGFGAVNYESSDNDSSGVPFK